MPPDPAYGCAGKTVATIELDSDGSDQELFVTFTDGTILRARSWDYEGYSSGLDVSVSNPGDGQQTGVA